MTRNKLKGTCLLGEFEPISVKYALDNERWIEAMNEEIEQIERKKTWTLVPRPKDKNVIGTKQVYRNSNLTNTKNSTPTRNLTPIRSLTTTRKSTMMQPKINKKHEIL